MSWLLNFINLKFEKFVVFGLKFWLEAQMSTFRTSLLAENRVNILEAFFDYYNGKIWTIAVWKSVQIKSSLKRVFEDENCAISEILKIDENWQFSTFEFDQDQAWLTDS